MEIVKKLNNNVVIALDEENKEIVITGKGISFDKTKGDQIDESLIEKRFILENQQSSNQFQQLIKDMPIEYLAVADEIIKEAQKQLACSFDDSIYTTITDHIHMSVQRFLEGITVPNILLADIKRFYPEEYQFCLLAVDKINATLKVHLPEDEAGFLVFHFVNARKGEATQEMTQVMKLVKEIINIIRYETKMDFDENSVFYQRFLTHVKFFAQRVFSKEQQISEMDAHMFQMVQQNYDQSAKVVQSVCRFLEKKYDFKVSTEEIFYLTIHIQTLMTKANNKNGL